MMGTKDRRFDHLPRDLSLEDLVPEDHFYRILEERLDLSFIREMVAPLYAGGGRPSVGNLANNGATYGRSQRWQNVLALVAIVRSSVVRERKT